MKQYRSLFAGRLASRSRERELAPVKHKKRRLGGILWGILKRTCMTLGAFVLITSLIGAFSTASLFKQSTPDLPDQMVLFLKLEGEIQETQTQGGFPDPFAVAKPTLHTLISTLDKGRDDPRVKGLYVRLTGGAQLQLTQIQELRNAIKRFQDSGKFAFIYAPSYGEGGGLGAYYFASAFKNIWMQPVGVVSVTGMRADVPFARKSLEKLGVEPEFLQRKEYKSAYESLSRSSMSAANREAMTVLLNDLQDTIVGDMAADRGIEPAAFMRLVDKGLFTSAAALESGLVTRIGYADMLAGDIAEVISGNRDDVEKVFVPLKQYAAAAHTKASKTLKKVALVHVNGTIMPSSVNASLPDMPAVSVFSPEIAMLSAQAPLGIGDSVAAADKIAPAIFAAADDPHIQTIVVRIDSPGGSPSASETILRSIQRAKTKGKTVVVSMGMAAASGGYWIASGADYIFASPSTLTGSIGVVGGKFSLAGLWDNLDINWESVGWGKNAGLWSLNTPFSESEKVQIGLMLDQVYNGFIDRVASGRHMTPEQVERIARGRVWSGKAALENGLVDAQGGLTDTLDYVAQLNGVQSRKDLDIVVMPKPKTPLEQFIELVESGGIIELFKVQSWFARQIKSLSVVLNNVV